MAPRSTATSIESTTGQRVGTITAVALAVALLAAVGFVIRVALLRFVANDFANVSRDLLWMSPLGYVILFAVASIPLMLLAPLLSLRQVTWLATWTFVTLALFDFAMPITEIGRVAALVLAAGVGALVARSTIDRGPIVRTMSFAIGLVLLGGLGAAAVLVKQRLPALAAAPSTPNLPNVLFIILDTVRADELGLHGYQRPTTPNIDAFAKSGVSFDAAFSTAPWTLPSHASMFTGRYPPNLVTDYKVPLDQRDSTLAEVLLRRGYATAGIVGNVWYTSWESGLQRGFNSYQDYQRSFEQVLKTTHLGRTEISDQLFRSRTLRDVKGAVGGFGFVEVPRPQPAPNTAKYVTDRFLDWHAERTNERPWFAFLNYFDAHDPYLPLEPWASRFAPAGGESTPRDRYDAELAYLDSHLGRLFEELQRRRGFENTIVVLTADHGEHFGERRQLGHFNSIYMPLLWVPLIVRYDGRLPQGARIAREISLRDVPATILDLAGVTASPIPGASLARVVAGDSSGTSPVAASYGVTTEDKVRALESGMLSMVEGGWHYILTGLKETEELFRYRSDPTEALSLVGSDSGLVVGPRMRARLYEAVESDRGKR